MRTAIRNKLSARLALVALAATTLVAVAGSPASASAAACPNEAVRVQQGVTTLLPECRGYEMVTPVNKNDEEVTVPSYTTGLEIPYQAAAQGAASSFTMTGGIPGSESAGEFVDSIGTATTAGALWSDLSLAPETRFAPIGTSGPRNGGQFVYYSPNLTCGVEKTPLPLAKNPGEPAPELAEGEKASEEIENLYVWNAPSAAPSESNRGSYTLVTKVRPRAPGESSPYSGGGCRVDGSAEGCSHISFETDAAGYELPVSQGSSEYAPRAHFTNGAQRPGPSWHRSSRRQARARAWNRSRQETRHRLQRGVGRWVASLLQRPLQRNQRPGTRRRASRSTCG